MKTWKGQVALERLPASSVMLREEAVDAYAAGHTRAAAELSALADHIDHAAEKIRETER